MIHINASGQRLPIEMHKQLALIGGGAGRPRIAGQREAHQLYLERQRVAHTPLPGLHHQLIASLALAQMQESLLACHVRDKGSHQDNNEGEVGQQEPPSPWIAPKDGQEIQHNPALQQEKEGGVVDHRLCGSGAVVFLQESGSC